jgi:hypothetical protein
VPINLNKSADAGMEYGHGHKKVVFKFLDKESAYDSYQGFRTTAINLKKKSEQFCCRDLEIKLQNQDSMKSEDSF